jgi:acetyl/propionyl-CoA carboxylase alpha subunit
MPSGPGLRVDAGVEAGDRVPPDYDPLVAKLMVVDATRELALERLARALDETVVGGVQTTLPFHRFVVRDPGFRAGPPPTDWVDATWSEALLTGRAAALEAAGWIAAAAAAGSVAPTAGPELPPGTGATTGPHVGDEPSSWTRAGRLRGLDRWPR